jgi:Flp pilus assembly protein TadB
MIMNNPSAKVFAVIFAVIIGAIGIAMPHTGNAASATEADTNTAAARGELSGVDTNISSATNAAAAAANRNSDERAFEIDKSGNHTGPKSDLYQWDINQRNNQGPPAPPVFGKTIVALAAIVCPFILVFGLPVGIIFTVFYFRLRQNKMVHETVRTMIEKGIPVTPEILASLRGKHSFDEDFSGKQVPGNPFDRVFPQRQKGRNRRLLPGLILTGVGLALIGGLPEHSKTGGWIVFFMGLAFLIVWLVDRNEARNYDRNNTERRQNDPQPPKQ